VIVVFLVKLSDLFILINDMLCKLPLSACVERIIVVENISDGIVYSCCKQLIVTVTCTVICCKTAWTLSILLTLLCDLFLTILFILLDMKVICIVICLIFGTSSIAICYSASAWFFEVDSNICTIAHKSFVAFSLRFYSIEASVL